MRRSRKQCALFLIAVFFLGGLIGPIMHQLDHAQTSAGYPPSRVSTHHTADAQKSVLLQDSDHDEVNGGALCWLCTVLQRGAALKAASITPEQHASGLRAPIRSSFPSLSVILLFLSRGPPVTS